MANDRAAELASRAWDARTQGDSASAAHLSSTAWAAAEHRPRPERQQVQVVCLAIAGQLERAWALASEHLAEFPGDPIVQRVLDTRPPSRPRLSGR